MTGIWLASYLALWLTVIALGVSVIALLRQIGVLHTRVAPMGVHFAGEGPDLDSEAPAVDGVDYTSTPYTLLAFTSPTCEICASLKPALQRLAKGYDEIDLQLIDHDAMASTFSDFRVRSTPYLIAVDDNGIVRSRGVANTLDQAEEMLAEVLAEPQLLDITTKPVVDVTDQPAGPAMDQSTGSGLHRAVGNSNNGPEGS